MDIFIKTDEDIAFEYELQKDPNDKVKWNRYIDKIKSDSSNGNQHRLHVVWLYKRCCLQLSERSNLDLFDIYLEFFNYLLFDINFTDLNLLIDDLLLNEFVPQYHKFNYPKRKFPIFEKICFDLLNICITRNELKYSLKVINVLLQNINNEKDIKVHIKLWKLLLNYVKLILDRTNVPNDNLEIETNEEVENLIPNLLISNNSNQNLSQNSNLFASHLLSRYLIVTPKKNINYILGLLYKTGNHHTVISSYEKYLSIKQLHNKNIPFDLKLNYLVSLSNCSQKDKYENFINILLDSILENEDERLIIIKQYCFFLIKYKEYEKLIKFISTCLSIDKKKNNISIELYLKLYDFFTIVEKALIDVYLTHFPTELTIINSHYDFLKSLLHEKDIKINDLKLSKNINQISYWFERLDIISSNKYKNYDEQEIVSQKSEIYKEAILKINPNSSSLVPGLLSKIWLSYADFYWNLKQYETAREVYNRALKVPFKYLLDLENIWLAWAKKSLTLHENGNVISAINIMEAALVIPEDFEVVYEHYRRNNKLNIKPHVPAQTVIFTSKKLWNFYLDLVEASLTPRSNLSQTEKVYDIYEKMIEVKVASPINFISYGRLLESKSLFESFQIYERAISTFPASTQYLIWTVYLDRANENKAALSTEHLRELYTEAIASMNDNNVECHKFYIMFSDFEELDNMMYKRSVDILIEGIAHSRKKNTKVTTIIKLWDLVIDKTERLLGNVELRPIYEECIQSLPNSVVSKYVLDFVKLEINLNEILRARQILQFGSQLLAPSKNLALWDFWDEFEIKHGNKDKYKDMLKLKKELELKMKINTEEVTKADGRIDFVAATTSKKELQEHINPDEVELDL